MTLSLSDTTEKLRAMFMAVQANKRTGKLDSKPISGIVNLTPTVLFHLHGMAELERDEAAEAASAWQPIETAPKSDEDSENKPLIVLQDGRRFVAEWDPCAGHWQGVVALDGIERNAYWQEWPGRLYGVTHWMPLPEPPSFVPETVAE